MENSPAGLHIAHGNGGIPGAFFNYEISPLLIRHVETRQSFAHFLTSYVSPVYSYRLACSREAQCRTCAIVGGVLTVASLIDSLLFATRKALKKSGVASPVNGGYTNGKLM